MAFVNESSPTTEKRKGHGCLVAVLIGVGLAILAQFILESDTRVGKNGAKGFTPGGPAPYVELAPGTRLVPDTKVGEKNWRYLVKDGPYQGVYVVVDEKDIE